jgi:hypothetical protein
VKDEPTAGVAVSVTTVPLANGAAQLAPQLIPAGLLVTEPDPDPLSLTVNVNVTVKVIPLLANPPTVTTTGPVVAPDGTGATIDVALQLVGVAAVPLKVTLFVPWVVPKLAPVIVTEVPVDPLLGAMLLIVGALT